MAFGKHALFAHIQNGQFAAINDQFLQRLCAKLSRHYVLFSDLT